MDHLNCNIFLINYLMEKAIFGMTMFKAQLVSAWCKLTCCLTYHALTGQAYYFCPPRTNILITSVRGGETLIMVGRSMTVWTVAEKTEKSIRIWMSHIKAAPSKAAIIFRSGKLRHFEIAKTRHALHPSLSFMLLFLL